MNTAMTGSKTHAKIVPASVTLSLPALGPVTIITLDSETRVTEADAPFTALIGRAPGVGSPPEVALRLSSLLAPESSAVVAEWCRTGHHAELEAGLLLRGQRLDGLPLVLLAHGLPGAFAGDVATIVDAERPHRRLLLQQAGGPVSWTGSLSPDTPPRAGADHVLAHDVRGAVRTARTFLGVHQRRIKAAAADARPGATPVPPAILDDAALGTALRALGTAEQAIDALVRYERLGFDPLLVAPVRLVDAVESAIARARSVCATLGALGGQHDLAGDLEVGWRGAAELTVVADADLLTWVLAELVVNARKFGRMPSDPATRPEITIAAHRDGPWIELQVISRGRGIDPTMAEDAFAPGRLLQPRDERPGSGLGLSMCRRIVSRHAGTIRFRTEPDSRTDPMHDHGAEAASEPTVERREPDPGTSIVELQLLADDTLDEVEAGARARETGVGRG